MGEHIATIACILSLILQQFLIPSMYDATVERKNFPFNRKKPLAEAEPGSVQESICYDRRVWEDRANAQEETNEVMQDYFDVHESEKLTAGEGERSDDGSIISAVDILQDDITAKWSARPSVASVERKITERKQKVNRWNNSKQCKLEKSRRREWEKVWFNLLEFVL